MFKINKFKKTIELTEEEYEDYANMEYLRMWRFPWESWIMSLICFLTGIFLVACLTVLEIIDEFKGNFWEYCIVISLFLLSGMFFFYARVETVTFDKESKKICKTKWILCYKWKFVSLNMKDLIDVNLILSGTEQKYSSTLYYKITLISRSRKPISILETKNRKKIIQKALKIRAFFNMKGKIPLKDISIN
jgi:hypothetical protein